MYLDLFKKANLRQPTCLKLQYTKLEYFVCFCVWLTFKKDTSIYILPIWYPEDHLVYTDHVIEVFSSFETSWPREWKFRMLFHFVVYLSEINIALGPKQRAISF